MLAGSDTHTANQKTLCGIKVKYPLSSVEELISAIVNKKTKPFFYKIK
jgi:hypothetical protein